MFCVWRGATKVIKKHFWQPLKIISLSVACWLKHFRNYLVLIKMADEKSIHQSPAKKKKQVKNSVYSLYFFATTYLFVSFFTSKLFTCFSKISLSYFALHRSQCYLWGAQSVGILSPFPPGLWGQNRGPGGESWHLFLVAWPRCTYEELQKRICTLTTVILCKSQNSLIFKL